MAFAWEMSLMQCLACERENAAGARFCAGCGAALERLPGDDPLVGTLLADRYFVHRKIAEGGMGVVYEAEQRMGSVSRRVAIKTLLPSVSRDRKLVARFYRECGTLSQLEHPNTIRLYDFGQTPDGMLYVAMEYADGRSLGDVVEEGPVPLDRMLDIVRQMSSALHEAHEKGIVHRDLKPDNVVLTTRAGEETVKLLDFGIATRIGGTEAEETKLTQQGTVLGTPPYMSPQQLAGEKVDRRSDIYSLGIIVYEMLTGQLPFQADTPVGWASQHMTGRPRPMRGVPAAIERAVLHALAKLPEDRPPTAPAFFRELEQASKVVTQDDAPVSAFDPTAPEGIVTSMMPGLPPDLLSKGSTVRAPYAPASAASSPPVALSFPPAARRRAHKTWTYALGFVLAAGGIVAAVALTAGRDFSDARSEPGATIPEQSSPPKTEISPLSPETKLEPTLPVSTPPSPEPEREPAVIKRRPSKRDDDKPPAKAPPVSLPPVATPPITTSPPVAIPTSPPAIPTVTVPTPPAATTPVPVPQLPIPRIPQPQPQQPPQEPQRPTQPSGPVADAACAAAGSRASAADIEGAVGLYRVCQSTGGSQNALNNARARIQAQGPAAVRRRAFNGDCAGARNAVAAASSIGAGRPAQAELSRTSCQ